MLKPGDRFGKYIVERLLGQGGMGAVYLVRHNILDSLFALKVLFPGMASRNEEFVSRFLREAKLACKIKHPNLIAVYDAGQDPDHGIYYLVMDYVSGGSVRDLLKKVGHLSIAQSFKIVEQVSSALEEAHRHNMVHRDIKPDNIMFAADGTAKLADLGIAKSSNDQDTMLTLETSVFGTPAYMSPEQALDSRKVDCRADIYSLGIVFFEMLSGQLPYHRGNTIEILSQVVNEDGIPDIRSIEPDIPADIAELVASMTAKKLEERVSSPTDLLKRLKKIQRSVQAIEPVVQTQVINSYSYSLRQKQNKEVGQVSASDVTVPILAKEVKPTERKEKTVILGSDSNQTAVTARYTALTTAPNEERNLGKDRSPVHSRHGIFSRRLLLPAIAALFLLCLLGGGLIMYFSQNEGHSSTSDSNIIQTGSPILRNPALPFEPSIGGQQTISATETGTGSNPSDVSAGSVMAEDELKPNAIVLLGEKSPYLKALKEATEKNAPSIPVIFQEANRFSQYRKQLTAIIDSSPKCVVLVLSARYAGLDLSRSNFESLIRDDATMLRDHVIPFVFILDSPNALFPKVEDFNSATRELCKLRSFPVFEANPRDVFPPVKEIVEMINVSK